MFEEDEEALRQMATTIVFGAAALALVAGAILVLVGMSKKQGASDVVASDNLATAKGSQKAAEEVAKHVETVDTVDKLEKGEF